MSFDKASQLYEERLPDLLKEGEGSFVVIANNSIAGIFPSFESALDSGYKNFEAGEFMIKEIRAQERVEMISCGVSLACPA